MSYMNDPMGSFQQPPVPQAYATQSYEQYPQLSRTLRTEDGFKDNVRVTTTLDMIFGVILAIALFFLVINIIDTVSSLSKQNLPASDFLTMFFITYDQNGFNARLWAEVWLPIIAIPILVILLIISAVTRGSTLSKAAEQFSRGGFVSNLVSTGIRIQTGRNEYSTVCTLADPSVPLDWARSAAQQMSTATKSSGARDYLKALRHARLNSSWAKPASQVDQSVPAGLYLTYLSGNLHNAVRVAVPDASNSGRFRLYTLKKKTALS